MSDLYFQTLDEMDAVERCIYGPRRASDLVVLLKIPVLGSACNSGAWYGSSTSSGVGGVFGTCIGSAQAPDGARTDVGG